MKLNIGTLEVCMGEAGLNFSKLAKVCGVSRTTLSYIKNGKSCKPDIGGKIAKGLGVSLATLIENGAATPEKKIRDSESKE